MRGQARRLGARLGAWGATLAAVATLVAGCGGSVGEGGDCPAGVKQATPSGYCVPRWLSLKRGEVFGRKGPGKDYATLYDYQVRDLPVQVVDETSDWRKICDPDGGVAWVASEMLDGKRTVMNTGAAPVPLRRDPAESAGAAAYLRPRAMAQLKGCRGTAWCEIEAAGAGGWVRANEVWGLSPVPQCR
jgi:SH3-like domain-containing protein